MKKHEGDVAGVQDNLKSLIELATSPNVDTKERLDNSKKLIEQALEEFASTKKDFLVTKGKLENISKKENMLRSWQEVVTIYHIDDLFTPSATTMITTDQGQQHENPQGYLDMSTLVEWSPKGYLSKLKQDINAGRIKHHHQKQVRTFSGRGDVTRSLFRAKEIHLLKTYSVEMPWNTTTWTKTEEVWVVQETLEKHPVLYVELDHSESESTDIYYKVYSYTRRDTCLWTCNYKMLPNSSKEYKLQLVNVYISIPTHLPFCIHLFMLLWYVNDYVTMIMIM